MLGKERGAVFLNGIARFFVCGKKNARVGGQKVGLQSTNHHHCLACWLGWAGLVKWRWGRKEKKERERERELNLWVLLRMDILLCFCTRTFLPATIERRRIYVHVLHIHQAMPPKKKKKKKSPPTLARPSLSLCNAPTYASHVRYRRTPSNDRSLFEFSPN